MHIFDRTIQVNRLSFNVLISSLTLLVCGLLMITSAACEKGEYFFIRQLIFIVLGLGGILILQKIPMRILWALTPSLYGIAIVLMEMGVILKIQHRNIIGGYRHG